MISIASNWRDYFDDRYEGLGTTYERFVLHRLFQKIKDWYPVKNVLEAPLFGITGISGINSMWWAAQNVPVTVVDCEATRIQLIRQIWRETGFEFNLIYQQDFSSLPFRNSSFDLSWNFCALGFIQDPSRLLAEMARVTRRAIFICLPNRTGIAPCIRRQFEKDGRVSRLNGDTGPEPVTAVLQKSGWECIGRGYFDVPPWPDIAMKKEEFLKRIGMGWFARALNRKEGRPVSIIDYFKGVDKNLETNMLKYSFLENSPTFFKKLWAHHEYLLFTPRDSDIEQRA
jgi:SAM-dependent methyltransferase